MLGTAAINAAPMRVDKWPMDTVAPPDPCAMKEARSFGQGLPCSGATLGRAEKSDQYVEMTPVASAILLPCGLLQTSLAND